MIEQRDPSRADHDKKLLRWRRIIGDYILFFGGLAGLCLLSIILSSCGFPAWRDQVLREVAEGRWQANSGQIGPGGPSSSQSIDFYGSDGRRLGYGRIQGGAVDVYNPDGSRAGYGNVRR